MYPIAALWCQQMLRRSLISDAEKTCSDKDCTRRSRAAVQSNHVQVDPASKWSWAIASNIRCDITVLTRPSLHISHELFLVAPSGWLSSIGPLPSFMGERRGAYRNEARQLHLRSYQGFRIRCDLRPSQPFQAHVVALLLPNFVFQLLRQSFEHSLRLQHNLQRCFKPFFPISNHERGEVKTTETRVTLSSDSCANREH